MIADKELPTLTQLSLQYLRTVRDFPPEDDHRRSRRKTELDALYRRYRKLAHQDTLNVSMVQTTVKFVSGDPPQRTTRN